MSSDTQDPAASPPRSLGLVWYAVAMVAYVVAGYFFKPVLMNWTLGPLFLVAALYVVPTLFRAAWTKLRTGPTT